MSDAERRELMAELARRVAAREAAGDYALEWLDAEVEPIDPPTPVDRYLQTPPGQPRGLREVAGRLRGASGEEQPLRDAIAWLKLALDAEQRAREAVAAAAVAADRARSAALRVLGDDVRALGRVNDARQARLEDDRRWIASATLRAIHSELAAPDPGPLDLEGVECRVRSQNGEDGILLHLFSLIGATNRRFVEIGIEDGRECNTANLALNFGWSGVMIDRDAAGVASAREFYAARPRTRDTVRVVQRTVTREDVDDLLVEAGAEGEIDLLSIDIDGNDLWVWEAVQRTSARLVVVEYNASFGPSRSVSVPYDPGFDRMARHPSGIYHGASLTALTRVAARKGYVLTGCDSHGVNAFFVRSDCADGVIAPTTPAEAWRPIRERGPAGTDEQFAVIAHLPLEDVP